MQSCSEGVSTSKRDPGPLNTVIHVKKRPLGDNKVEGPGTSKTNPGTLIPVIHYVKKRPLGDNKVEGPGTSKVQELMELLPNKAQKAEQLKNDQHVLQERKAKTKKEAEILQELAKKKREEFAKAYKETVKEKKEAEAKVKNTLEEIKRTKKEEERKRQQEAQKLEMEQKQKLQRIRDERRINNKRMKEEAREHSPRSAARVHNAKRLIANIQYKQHIIDEHQLDQGKLSKRRKMEIIGRDLDKKIFGNLPQDPKDKDLIEERQEDQEKKKEVQETKNKEESKERNDFKTAKPIKKKEDERRDHFERDERRKKGGHLLGKDEKRKEASTNGVQIPKSTPKQDISDESLFKLRECNKPEFDRYNASKRVSPATYEELTRAEQANCIPMNAHFKEYLKYRKEYLPTLKDDITAEGKDAYTYILVS